MQKKLGTVKDDPKYDVASLFVPFMFTGLHSHSFQENQDKPIQDFSSTGATIWLWNMEDY